MRVTIRQVCVAAVSVSVALGVVTSCTSGAADEEWSFVMASPPLYAGSIADVDQLVALSEVVVVARIAGEESTSTEQDFAMAGEQAFEVVEVPSGDGIDRGAVIRVVRLLPRPPDAGDATVVTPGGGFVEDWVPGRTYLLGLVAVDPSGDRYRTIYGPDSVVAFDGDDESAKAVPDAVATSLQRALAGQDRAAVVDAIARAG